MLIALFRIAPLEVRNNRIGRDKLLSVILEDLINGYLPNCSPATKNNQSIKSFVDKLTTAVAVDQSKNSIAGKITDAIDDTIRSSHGDKKKLAQFADGLCKYAKAYGKLDISPSILDADIIDNPLERRLRIAGFLHSPKTREEIHSRFAISVRTISSDLNALEGGFTFMGQTIQIKKSEDKGQVYYQSTLHPVFLPLNLSEVYALTTGLLQTFSADHPLYETYKYLAEYIYSQLSEYGQDIIYDSADRSGIEFPPVGSKKNGGYRDERTLVKRREGALLYLLKRGEMCDITYNENGYTKEIRGRVRLTSTGREIITVVTEDQQTELEYAKILTIKPVKYR